VISGWHPAELHLQALPCCHYMMIFSLTEQKKTLDLSVFIRSNDVGLGMPFNIAQYAFLLHLIAKITKKKVGNLHYHVTNVHIYEDHIEPLAMQIQRTPIDCKPKLWLSDEVDSLWFLETTDKPIEEWAKVVGYEHHPPIKMNMAV
jgi:thymidylate synthase